MKTEAKRFKPVSFSVTLRTYPFALFTLRPGGRVFIPTAACLHLLLLIPVY